MNDAIYNKFLAYIKIDNFKSVLCLNGELPEESFFHELNVPIIAADGAANHLLRLNIIPDAIVGDLDSFEGEHSLNTHIEHMPDQSFSDFQKAKLYMKKNDLLPCVILGMNGGHLDHIYNNLNIFLEDGGVFFAPPIVGYVCEKGSHALALPRHTKVSIYGIPFARLSTMGFKWDLEDIKLEFFGQNSPFNRIADETASIIVREGKVLILAYLN